MEIQITETLGCQRIFESLGHYDVRIYDARRAEDVITSDLVFVDDNFDCLANPFQWQYKRLVIDVDFASPPVETIDPRRQSQSLSLPMAKARGF